MRGGAQCRVSSEYMPACPLADLPELVDGGLRRAAYGLFCSCCCSYQERQRENHTIGHAPLQTEQLTDSCAASIIGSWISVYILASALNPPGRL